MGIILTVHTGGLAGEAQRGQQETARAEIGRHATRSGDIGREGGEGGGAYR